MIEQTTTQKVRAVRLNKEQEEIIDEISEYTGIAGFSNIVRYTLGRIVIDLRKERESSTPRRRPKSALEKAEQYITDQAARREVRAEHTLKAQCSIADRLQGTVFDNENKKAHVRYTTYEVLAGKVVSNEQVEPLSALTVEHLKLQYKPSRDEVNKIKKS